MSVTVDEQKRVLLPNAKPGEKFEIQMAADGVFILKRLDAAQASAVKARFVKENGFTVIETGRPVDETALKEALAEFP